MQISSVVVFFCALVAPSMAAPAASNMPLAEGLTTAQEHEIRAIQALQFVPTDHNSYAPSYMPLADGLTVAQEQEIRAIQALQYVPEVHTTGGVARRDTCAKKTACYASVCDT